MATKVVMLKYKWIFAPIHVQQHWILLVAHVPSMSVCVLDSLNKNNNEHYENFRKYIRSRRVGVGELAGKWRKMEGVHSTQQVDGHSCGDL